MNTSATELQSLNEELTTVNEHLLNQELAVLNNDLSNFIFNGRIRRRSEA